MGEKAKLDDKDKAAPVDVGPDRPAPQKEAADEEDRLGGLANADPAIGRSLKVVENSFMWFNDAAQQRLETLRRDLKKEDEPDWIAQAAEGLLELALGEGATRAAKYITGKLVKKRSANAGLVE